MRACQGNDRADWWAKHSLSELAQPDPHAVELYKFDAESVSSLVQLAGKTLLFSPSPNQGRSSRKYHQLGQYSKTFCVGLAAAPELLGPWLCGKGAECPITQDEQSSSGAPFQAASQAPTTHSVEALIPVPAPVGPVPDEGTSHVWKWNGKRWICRKCLRFAKSRPPADVCLGFHPELTELVHNRRGHELIIAEYQSGDAWLIICKKCGKMSEGGHSQTQREVRE